MSVDNDRDETARKNIESAVRKTADQYDYKEIEQMLPEQFDDLFKTLPLTEETTCGIWFIRGHFWQKLANKKVYVLLYGIIGCVYGSSYAYFNGTITTLEKRYKIPSRNTGIISVGNDISQLLVSAVLSYYAGKGHRPRWMALGLLTIIIFCILNIIPHYLYGPGEDALSLTLEYGAQFDENGTLEMLEREKRKMLCNADDPSNVNVNGQCSNGDDAALWAPQIFLFTAQFISGIGQPLYSTLGISYMDDNIQKSKTPAFVSLSMFMRMLAPALGYTLASMSLKLYISPSMTPTINDLDPRWLGAWWLGWLVLAVLLIPLTLFLAMFPKTLPRAAVRRAIQNEKVRREMAKEQPQQEKASMTDMMVTFKRLLGNATFMFNNVSSLFFCFGYMPYWIFTAKYIETQYRQSASVSSLVTGTVALVFAAIGILLGGFLVTKFKPSARWMASWNIVVGILTALGMTWYMFLGCADNERAFVLDYPLRANSLSTCNSDCGCDFVKYSPVCGENGNTYISGCHAGCTEQILNDGNKIFTDCSCIEANNATNFPYVRNKISGVDFDRLYSSGDKDVQGGVAVPGSCPVNCQREFFIFLAVMCMLKFFGASARTTNFLVSIRCVEEHDKPVAMGFGITFHALFAFIPGPIFFGWILDRACIVWGKTCSGKGNCWLYHGEYLRYTVNMIAAIFITISVLFDIGVWYFVKNLKVFDEEVQDDGNSAQLKQLKSITESESSAEGVNASKEQ